MENCIVGPEKVECCYSCGGTGKVTDCEYTPPFERFIRNCSTCGGTGKLYIKIDNRS